MIRKTSAIAIAAVAIVSVLGSTGAHAQENCVSMQHRMMGLYQANPYSPEYAQMLPYYNANCVARTAYQAPQPNQYSSYGYQQPAYGYGYVAPQVDPGAAIVGAAIVGGAIAAEGDYRGRDDWGDHRWRR